MRFLVAIGAATVTAAAASVAAAAGGDEIYRDNCALCHDAGAGQAPRIGSREDWKARFPKGRAGLSRLEFQEQAPAPVAKLEIRKPAAVVDDATLARDVAEALQRVRIGGVRVESTNGVVALMGVVDDNNAVRTALAAAQAVPGVREIDNRLVSAALFEWD